MPTGFDRRLNPPLAFQAPDPIRAPVMLDIPHSGRIYPQDLMKGVRLDQNAIRKSEDPFVDELFRGAAAMGCPTLSARFPRVFVDVNREPYELDPEMFDSPLPEWVNSRSPRVAAGIGTIAKLVCDGVHVYEERLRVADAIERINSLYAPYHSALEEALAALRARFGIAILIDCHSMPSTASAEKKRKFIWRRKTQDEPRIRADFVLGNRCGISCDSFLTIAVRDSLEAMGYSVALNDPYAGGFIAERYGKPIENVHVLQIEVNRRLYLNEPGIEKTSNFPRLKNDMTRLIRELIEAVNSSGRGWRIPWPLPPRTNQTHRGIENAAHPFPEEARDALLRW